MKKQEASKKIMASGSGAEKEDLVQSQQGGIHQGGDDADEAVRARVEREQAETMAEDENK